jgi:hypothetical protein
VASQRAEQDVGDEQRVVQGQVEARGHPGRCRVEAQVGGQLERQEQGDDHEQHGYGTADPRPADGRGSDRGRHLREHDA